MKRIFVRTATIWLAAIAFALGAAGCLHDTGDESESAPALGGGTLNLFIFPGLIEEGIDPPIQIPVSDPFEDYDCENASYDDDICEYYVCQAQGSWDSIVELCLEGAISLAECEYYLNCSVAYVECIEDHCDPVTGMSYDDQMLCATNYADCVGY